MFLVHDTSKGSNFVVLTLCFEDITLTYHAVGVTGRTYNVRKGSVIEILPHLIKSLCYLGCCKDEHD